MSKQCYPLLTLSVLFIYLIHSAIGAPINVIQKEDQFGEYNQALVTILEKCNLKPKNIILFDNNRHSTTVDALTVLQPPITVSLRSELILDDLYMRTKKDPIDVTGVILVLNEVNQWSVSITNIGLFWELRNGCIIIVVFKVKNYCQHSGNFLKQLAHLHFATSFYICSVPDSQNTIIYTHDPYGNTIPSNWITDKQLLYQHYNWTLYKRVLRKADICKGFNFNRTDPTTNPRIEISVVEAVYDNKLIRRIITKNISLLDGSYRKENILALEKVLNTKFIYNIRWERRGFDTNSVYYDLMVNTGVSAIINDIVFGSRKQYRSMSFPTWYDDYVIISQSRGLATPLEKIRKFYGIWTLISLIAVLGISFIVIWLKTNRNFALASFDTLRLLINSGIVTPIDTLALKIFFMMIFLYIIVIHATFSGNLAKFLTIPAYLENIDSLQDLADPRIRKVFTFFYTLDDDIDPTGAISRKAYHYPDDAACLEIIVNNTDIACIRGMNAARSTMVNLKWFHLHISNQKLKNLEARMVYRQRSPFIEQFNWALIVLSETQIYHRTNKEKNEYSQWVLRQREENAQIEFRSITLHDLTFAFILLAIGNSLGLICFLIEIFIDRYQCNGVKFAKLKKFITFTKKDQEIQVQKTKVRKITVLPKNKSGHANIE